MAASKVEKCRRITFKRKQPNPLFQGWLEYLLEEAKNSNSNCEPMLREALASLAKYPLPLKSGAECAILKGFNKKLCGYLDKHLEVHYSCEAKHCIPDQYLKQSDNACNGLESDTQLKTLNDDLNLIECSKTAALTTTKSQVLQTMHQVQNVSSKRSRSPSDSPHNAIAPDEDDNGDIPIEMVNKKSKERMYRPAFRSGGYAILLALLEHLQDNSDNPGLPKEDIIDKAQKHSEESFVRPKPESYYTAWSNMARLVTKGLIIKTKKKKMMYSLTPAGVFLATELLKESNKKVTVNDLIFNHPVSSMESIQDTPVATLKGADSDSVSSHLMGSQSSSGTTAVNLPAGSFDVILLIDKNETGGLSKKNDPTVAQFNKYPDLKHEYRSLKVGDFTWIARHKIEKDKELVLPYVVERKRMDDLGSSIKDGRFHEQKFRLRKCGLKNVIYMIENYGSNKHVGLPLQSLLQALANTRVQDGFKIHTTDSLSNSARFLAMMTKRLTIDYKERNLIGYDCEPANDDLMTFKYFNKSSAKSKPLTVTETFIKLLLQLKGVSVEKALAITNKYSTPYCLMKAYEDCNSKEGEILLAHLKYGDNTRNVGPKTSKSIYQLFTQRVLS